MDGWMVVVALVGWVVFVEIKDQQGLIKNAKPIYKNFTNSVRNPRAKFLYRYAFIMPPPGIIIVQNHMINRVNH